MNIKITSDSTCDLSKELTELHNITLFPLTVIKGGQAYKDGVDITPSDIFAHVAAGGDLCSTTAMNVGEYEEWFSKFSAEYDGVLHINLSSCLSSSYQNACLAAEDFENVRVVDSLNLSTGQGLIVLKACELAKTCTSLDELQHQVQEFATKVESSFVIDQLAYMVKGGRCSSAAALGANLLNLKPCIEVKEGKLTVVKKYRGNYTKCLSNYAKDRLCNRDDIDTETLFITHTPVDDSSIEAVKNTISENCQFKTVTETDAGCTISCHCGPGTLGLLFARK